MLVCYPMRSVVSGQYGRDIIEPSGNSFILTKKYELTVKENKSVIGLTCRVKRTLSPDASGVIVNGCTWTAILRFHVKNHVHYFERKNKKYICT